MLSNYPVFTPTEEEFAHFAKFMASIEDKCKYHGCCKIIPPKSWRPNNFKARDFAKLNIHIDTPIKQFTNEIAKGVYQQFHEEQPGVTIQAFKDLSLNSSKFIQPPDLTENDDDAVVDKAADAMDVDTIEESGSKKRRSRRLKAKDWSQTQDASLATAPVITPLDNPYAHIVHNTLSRKQIDKIEQRYWASLKNTEFPAMYGADVPATVFDDAICKNWNLAHLDTMLYRKLKKANVLVPGINTPYLYIGMFKSTFAWHTEDLELHSINYMHLGAPKTWYVIPPAHAEQFEQLVKRYFADSFKECDQFLRHKCVMIAPYILQQHNIPYSRITQEVNQFVVTFPRSYHGGFNHAFNCAEAVNFATPEWIPIGKQAQVCKCTGDSVRIHMSMFEPCNKDVTVTTTTMDPMTLSTTTTTSDYAQQHAPATATDPVPYIDPDMTLAMTGEQFEVIDDPYTQRGLQFDQVAVATTKSDNNGSGVRVKIKLNNNNNNNTAAAMQQPPSVQQQQQQQQPTAAATIPPQPLVMKRKMMAVTAKKKKATSTTTTTPQQAAMTSSFHIKPQQYTFHHHHIPQPSGMQQQQQQPTYHQQVPVAFQQQPSSYNATTTMVHMPPVPIYHQQQQQQQQYHQYMPTTPLPPPIMALQQQQQPASHLPQQYPPLSNIPPIYSAPIAKEQVSHNNNNRSSVTTMQVPPQQHQQQQQSTTVKVTVKKPVAPSNTTAPQAPLKMMSPELAEKLAKQKQQMGIQKKSKNKHQQQQEKKKKMTASDKLLQVLLTSK